MKLVFEGENLADIHQQIIATAYDLEGSAMKKDAPAVTVSAPTFHHSDTSETTGKGPVDNTNEVIVGRSFGQSGPSHQEFVGPASSVPTSNTPSPLTGTERDAAGLPWDPRIHSGSQEKNKDGTWKKRRGVTDKAYIGQIEAEIRGQGQAAPQVQTVAQAYQAPAQVIPMPTAAQRVPMPEAPVLSQMAINTPAPTFGAPPMPRQGVHSFESFRSNMMSVLTDLVNEGNIDHNWLNHNRAMFNGAPVEKWADNEQTSRELFNYLVSQGMIKQA